MEQLDEGGAAEFVYMDFSNAFDKLLHGRLIRKTEIHGIHGDLIVWIQDWLTYRRQREVLEG